MIRHDRRPRTVRPFRAAGSLALVAVVASGLAACTGSAETTQQPAEFPAAGKTITLLIPYSAGGGTDLSGRLLASSLEAQLDAKIVVENVPAGSGQEAIRRLSEAEPDGYTLAFTPLPATNMMYLDAEREATFGREDFAPIANHDSDPVAIAVSANSPWKTLDDVVEAARAKPGKVTAGSNGVLAAGHLGLLRFTEAAGVDISWSTFEDSGQLRGSVIGQSVDLEVQPVSELVGSARSGDLRILGMLDDERLPGLDDVPAAGEAGYEKAEVTTNRVLVAPSGLPQETRTKLQKAVQTATEDSAYQAKAAKRLLVLNYMDADATAAMWKDFDGVFGQMAKDFREGGE